MCFYFACRCGCENVFANGNLETIFIKWPFIKLYVQMYVYQFYTAVVFNPLHELPPSTEHCVCLPISDTLASGLAVSTNELMS